jgi:hypothetical protein
VREMGRLHAVSWTGSFMRYSWVQRSVPHSLTIMKWNGSFSFLFLFFVALLVLELDFLTEGTVELHRHI